MKSEIKVLRLISTESTNQYAAKLIAENKAVHGMVITTREQTSGKGQDGNYWESKAGENLTISIVIQPNELTAAKQFVLNKLTSLAVRDFVELKVTNHPVRIKWPNDVYIGDRKVAGILINNTILGNKITWSIIGIGVNVNQTGFESDAPNPISLKQAINTDLDLDDCLSLLYDAFDTRLRQLSENNFKQIDSDYLAAMYRLGVVADYIYKDQKIKAKITGTGEFGRLQLLTEQGEVLNCDLKEIKFLI